MQFSDWFNEIEVFSLRCERFYDDVQIEDMLDRETRMIKWLIAAYEQGRKDAKI